MQVFIWERLEQVSSSYHQDGGLVVIAPSLEEARRIIAEKVDDKDDMYPVDCDAKHVEPDHVYEVSGEAEEAVFVFPDAGCC